MTTAAATRSDEASPAACPRRRSGHRLGTALAWAAALAVLVVSWPHSLGGPTSYILVSGTSMEPTMHTGDLAVVRAERGYEPGDIIAYRIPEGSQGAGFMVIHRVIGGSGAEGYVVQGDNRTQPDLWRPTDDDVIGSRVALVPRAGRVLRHVANPAGVGAFLAALTVALVVSMPADGSRRGGDDRGPASRLLVQELGNQSGPADGTGGCGAGASGPADDASSDELWPGGDGRSRPASRAPSAAPAPSAQGPSADHLLGAPPAGPRTAPAAAASATGAGAPTGPPGSPAGSSGHIGAPTPPVVPPDGPASGADFPLRPRPPSFATYR